MTWSYSAALATNKDKVRREIGDTVSSDPLLEDEEIEYALTAEGSSVLRAAARCCEFLAARFARETDASLGEYSESRSQKARMFAERARELRARASAVVSPYCGGLSEAEKETAADDTDLVQPFFKRDMWDPTSTSVTDTKDDD